MEPPVAAAGGQLAYNGKSLPSGYSLMDFNFKFLSLDPDDPAYDWRKFDVGSRCAADEDDDRDSEAARIADLRPFQKHGGKLIIYHGWADPGISAYGTLAYHEAVVKAVGGEAIADRFLRTYFVPGMHHCGGGAGPNQFDMIGGTGTVGREGSHTGTNRRLASGGRQDRAHTSALSRTRRWHATAGQATSTRRPASSARSGDRDTSDRIGVAIALSVRPSRADTMASAA